MSHPVVRGHPSHLVKWHRMAVSERKAHLQEMSSDMPEYAHSLTASHKLAVPATEVELSYITCCKTVWVKAEQLLCEPTAIAPAPGIEGAQMVAGDSSSRPHLAKQSKLKLANSVVMMCVQCGGVERSVCTQLFL